MIHATFKTLLKSTFLMCIVFFIDGCESNTTSDNVVVESAKSLAVNQLNNEKKTYISKQEYQLQSIDGFFSPGAVYEFDSIENSWCERPLARDIMRYQKEFGIEDLSDLPDLNTYFDQKITNMLNSCKIIIKTYNDSSIVFLHFRDKIIYESSVALISKPNKEETIITIRNLPKFDLSSVPGSMMLSEGRNYQINLSQKPSISFANEIGNYRLNFSDIKFKPAQNKNLNSAFVYSEKAYFHDKPDSHNRRNAFVVKGQIVLYDTIKDGFTYAQFINSAGIKTKGWILNSELEYEAKN